MPVCSDFVKSPAHGSRSLFLGLARRRWERQREPVCVETSSTWKAHAAPREAIPSAGLEHPPGTPRGLGPGAREGGSGGPPGGGGSRGVLQISHCAAVPWARSGETTPGVPALHPALHLPPGGSRLPEGSQLPGRGPSSRGGVPAPQAQQPPRPGPRLRPPRGSPRRPGSCPQAPC